MHLSYGKPKHLLTLIALILIKIEVLKPEVIIIGTGKKHLFLDRSLLKQLVALGIGYEVTTTSAACRTYNILISEDRRVVAALFQ